MGRPTKFKEEYISEGEKYAAIGLPLRDMAFIWDVTDDTITNWKAEHPDFSDALKRGEARKKMRLLTAMFKSAENGNAAVQIFLAKNWLDMRDAQAMDHAGEIKVLIERVVTSIRPEE